MKIEYSTLWKYYTYPIFFLVYFFLWISLLWHPSNLISYQSIYACLPLSAIFITCIYAFLCNFTHNTPYQDRYQIFLQGVADLANIDFYTIIIAVPLFNHVMGSMQSFTKAVHHIIINIPSSCIVPFFFIVSIFHTIIIGNVTTAIILLLPISYTLAACLRMKPIITAVIVISGALIAHNFCIYLKHIKKTENNRWLKHIIYCIFFIELCILLYFVQQFTYTAIDDYIITILQSSYDYNNYITIIPYICLYSLYVYSLNSTINLIIASLIALIIKMIMHNIYYLDAIITFFQGVTSQPIIMKILLFHIFFAGLINIINHNGGNSWCKPQKLKEQNNIFNTIATFIKMILIHILYMTNLMKDNYKNKEMHVKLQYLITEIICQILVPYGSCILLTMHYTQSDYVSIITILQLPVYTMIIVNSIILYTISCM